MSEFTYDFKPATVGERAVPMLTKGALVNGGVGLTLDNRFGANKSREDSDNG